MNRVHVGLLKNEEIDKGAENINNHHLKPGTILDERFRIEKTIGEGGFGITYLGISIHQGEKVAIKEFFWKSYMDRDQTGSKEVFLSREKDRKDYEHQKRRFLKEARIIREFAQEPGIVQVKDYFEENETAYIVMEFLEGKTLKQELSGGKTMDPEQAFRLLLPLMETLKKIHDYGVIHRDISPDNIMVGDDQTLTLIDFGAARDYWKLDDETRSVILKGGYAACEQYDRHGRLGPWTDIYGLCAVLYFCITGNSPDDAFQRMLHDEQKSPRELGIQMDSRLEKILMKGLSVEYASRYQNMEDFIKAVREIVREKDPKEVRKKRLFYGGLVLAGLGVLLGLGDWYYQSHLEQFKFRGQETIHLAIARPQDMEEKIYEQQVDILKDRMELLVGEDNYIMKKEKDEVRAVIPLERCTGMMEKDISSDEFYKTELNDLLTLFLTKQGRLYLDDWLLTSENVKQAQVKKGTVEGYSSEELAADEYYYLELKLTDDLAGELKSRNLRRKEKKIEMDTKLYLDKKWVVADSEDFFVSAMRQASVVYDMEDDTTLYVILRVQDPDFYKLLVYDIFHSPYEEALSGSYLPPTVWETTETALLTGQYQKNEEEIAAPAVYLEYQLSSYSKEGLTNGQWYHVLADFKTMLDTLEIPYAFGVSKAEVYHIRIKIPKADFYPELMDLMTEKSIHLQDLDYTVSEQIGDFDNLIFHPYGWELQFTSEYEINSIEQNTAKMLKKGRDTLYLMAGDCKIAKMTLTEPVKDGSFLLSDIFLDTSKISAEKVYRFLRVICSEVSYDSSWTLKTAVFTDEKGELQADSEIAPFRVLRREKLEEVQKAAARIDREIEVEDSLDTHSSLQVSLPLQEGKNPAVEAAKTVKKLAEESRLLDGFYMGVNVSIKREGLKEGEGILFYFFAWSSGNDLTVKLGEDWKEAYEEPLKEFFEKDEFYRQFIDSEKFSFY